MSTDPNLMAAMLQGTEPSLSPEDLQQLMQTSGGRFASGLGQGYVGPYLQAAKAGYQYMQDPIAGGIGLTQALQQAPEAIGGAQERLAQKALHPGSTAEEASQWLRGVISDPEKAGQVVGGLLPGPGQELRGAEGDALSIWGGPKSRTYDPLAAQAAEQTTAQGFRKPDVFNTTGGYYVPPREYGQTSPWQWIDDTKAKLAPGAISALHDEAQFQFDHRFEALQHAYTLRKKGDPNTEAYFTQLARDMKTAQSPDELSDQARGFMHRIYPMMGPTNSLSLGDVLHHPDLYAAYPGLKDYRLDVEPWGGSYGSSIPSEGRMTVGNFYDPTGAASHENQVLNTLLHESTHVIQSHEGMPFGASTGRMAYFTGGSISEPGQLEKAVTELPPGPARDIAGEHFDRLLELGSQKEYGSDPHLRMYQNVAGEVQARLPYPIRHLQQQVNRFPENDPLAGTKVPPFGPQAYAMVGASPQVREHVVITPGSFAPGGRGGIYEPRAAAYPELQQYGLRAQMLPAGEGPDISAMPRGAGEQLALGLRRAPVRKPKAVP